MIDWVERRYGKGEIDRAGAALVPWWTNTGPVPREEIGPSYLIIDNWRTSHGYPLNAFQITLRKRARKIDPSVLVAQRLKRFASVMNKLAREPNMKLSQMQDLGGCRAILSDVAKVNALMSVYTETDRDLFGAKGRFKCSDYITNPKKDGYRGIHIIGKFLARQQNRESWNGHRIEVQLRTRLQHAFATTVETVTTFTRLPLKSGGGSDDWKRFFRLMGSTLALREGTPFVADTPDDPAELLRELREYSRMLKVRQRLRGWSSAMKILPKQNTRKYKSLLLLLNIENNTMQVEGFDDPARAGQALARIEAQVVINNNLDAVLVNVSRVQDLRKAYPNYYADTREFISALDLALKQS